MKKKFLSVFLAGAMVLSLAACGNSGSGDSGNSSTKKEEGGSSEGGNKLTVWAWDQTFNIKAMEMAGEQYKKDHPDFEIEIVETSSDDCQTKLTTCANAGDYSTMPDIVLMQDNSYQKFLKSYPDAFTDLTDCGINWDDFAALKQSYSMVDDKHYGVPYDNGVCAAFYRTDVLDEAGYKIEDLTDITWSEFIKIGENVHKKTGKYLLTSESTGGDTIMLMIQSCGANFVNEDGEAFIVGNETAEKCIDLYTEMIEKDVVKLVNNWDEYIKTVTDGEAAGIVNGNWMNATLVGIEDQKGLWQITTLPKVDGVDTATNYANNGGSSWYITSNCQNVELAMDFLKSTFGSSTDFYDSILPATSGIACYLPAGESEVYNEPVEFYGGQPIYSTLVEYSSHIPEFTKTPYHYEARECVNTAIINITNGTSKEDALKEAQETLEFKMTE
ncbi:MAG: extracellular solute-binding protein [Dorea sp.]|nr:extracellular solute-binding protein [Dorea sp.]